MIKNGKLNIQKGLFIGEKELKKFNDFRIAENQLLLTKKNSRGLFDLNREGFVVDISGSTLTFFGNPSILGFTESNEYIVFDKSKSISISPSNNNHCLCIRKSVSSFEEGTLSISQNGDVIGSGTRFTETLRSSVDKKISRIRVNGVIYNINVVLDDTHMVVSNPPVNNILGANYSVIGISSPYSPSTVDMYTYNSYEIYISPSLPNETTDFILGRIDWSGSKGVFYWMQNKNSIISTQNSTFLFDTEISSSQELKNLGSYTTATNVLIKKGVYEITLTGLGDRVNVPASIKYLYAEPGTLINVRFTDPSKYLHSVFYFNSDCTIENIHVKSLSEKTTILTTAIRGVRGKVVSCSSSNFSMGFAQCNNLINCYAFAKEDLDATQTVTSPEDSDINPIYALYNKCYNIINCVADIDFTGSSRIPLLNASIVGFGKCVNLSGCSVVGVSGISYGYCTDINNCAVKGLYILGFSDCDRLSQPSIISSRTTPIPNITSCFVNCNYITSPFVNHLESQSNATTVTAFYSCNNISMGNISITVAGAASVIGAKYVSNMNHCIFNLTIATGIAYGVTGDASQYNDMIINNNFTLNNQTTTLKAIGLAYCKRCRGNNIAFAKTADVTSYSNCFPTLKSEPPVGETSSGGFNESNVAPPAPPKPIEPSEFVSCEKVAGNIILTPPPPFFFNNSSIIQGVVDLAFTPPSGKNEFKFVFNYSITRILLSDHAFKGTVTFSGNTLNVVYPYNTVTDEFEDVAVGIFFESSSPSESVFIYFQGKSNKYVR